MSSTDFTASKGFRFKQRYKLQFRAEFFNLSNIRQFGFASTAGTAGVVDNHATFSALGQVCTAGPAGKI